MAFLVVSLSSFILSLILLLSFQHDGGIGVSALVVDSLASQTLSGEKRVSVWSNSYTRLVALVWVKGKR